MTLAGLLGALVIATLGMMGLIYPSIEVARIGHTRLARAVRIASVTVVPIILAGIAKYLFG